MKKKAPKPVKKRRVTKPATASPPRSALNVPETLLARLRATKPDAAPKPVPVFGLPQHPPGVGPENPSPTLAVDSAITDTQIWAGAFALSGYFTEGITFVGYPYLAEMAQRPEYRMMSETLAGEMTRKWIRFTSTDSEDDKSDRINELEAEFKRLKVRSLFGKAAEQDGFFGRGHIYIDTGDTDDPAELRQPIGDGWDETSKAKIGKQKPITALRTVEAVWCYPTSYNSSDPLQDNWYRPDNWYVQAKVVHTSRLLTFVGREVPDLLKPTYSFGGLSLSQMAKPYVDNWLKTRQGVNDIISAFTVFVLLTQLGEALQSDGQELFRRAELFNLLRSNRGLMMLDKESEDFKNVSASLAGLDQLQAQAQEHMASVSHIPVVKLLGIQPAGLNASSEGELRSFYDFIHSFQEHLYRDPLKRLLGLIMLSIWGEVDDAIDFEFVPLWSLDEKGEAEVEKVKAETDAVLVDLGALGPEEVRKRVASDPGSDYASIDVEDMPELPEEFLAALTPEGAGPLDREAEAGKNAAQQQPEAKAAA